MPESTIFFFNVVPLLQSRAAASLYQMGRSYLQRLSVKGSVAQKVSKISLCLFDLLQKNGRKSHRYEKKTVLDILGVVYQYTVPRLKQKTA